LRANCIDLAGCVLLICPADEEPLWAFGLEKFTWQYEVSRDAKATFITASRGWTGTQRNSIIDGLQINDEIVLVFGIQQDPRSQGRLWIGVWPATGGKPKLWHQVGEKELEIAASAVGRGSRRTFAR